MNIINFSKPKGILSSIPLIVLAVVLSLGCSHNSPKPCQELDWHEIGRMDGVKGISDNQRRQVHPVCAESDASLAEALYHNGFDKGISQFCSYDTGFSFGRMRKSVSPVCPPLLQDDFDRGYRQGERFSELERQRNEVSFRLKSLREDLSNSSIDLARRGLIQGEKLELEKKQKDLEQEIAQVQKNPIK